MTHCYECDNNVTDLSPRSRCVSCEYRRAIFNENEVDKMSEVVALLKSYNDGVDDDHLAEAIQKALKIK